MEEGIFLSTAFLGKNLHDPMLALVQKGVIPTGSNSKDNALLEVCFDFKSEAGTQLLENAIFHNHSLSTDDNA